MYKNLHSIRRTLQNPKAVPQILFFTVLMFFFCFVLFFLALCAKFEYIVVILLIQETERMICSMYSFKQMLQIVYSNQSKHQQENIFLPHNKSFILKNENSKYSSILY